jgi:GR25 family glycosyltransferase involved in LPS biosynthesis
MIRCARILVLAIVVIVVLLARFPDTYDDPKLPLYVINLKRRSDRLEACLNRIPDPIVIEAVDGYALPPSKSSKLTKGERGCFLSHLKALQRIANGPDRYAIVLEDDAVLNFPDCFKRIQKLIRQAPPEFGVIALGCNAFPPEVIDVAPGLCVFPNYDLCGAHALLYSRKGAEKFLRHAMKYGTNDVPFDLWLTQSRAAPVLIATPPLATVTSLKDTDTQKTR